MIGHGRATGALPFALLLLALAAVFPASAGELRIRIDTPRGEVERAALALLERFHLIEQFDEVVRSEFILPHDVHLRIGGEDGPLYDPNIVTIVIPYFFVDEVAARLEDVAPDVPDGEIDEVVVGVVEHTLYHELGHALVDLLDLPLAQKEEDAVDTLATVLMTESFEEGEFAALDAMEDFLALDELEGDTPPAYFVEHSMDIERYNSGVCLAHGSNPAATPEVAVELGAAAARACVGRWQRARARWFRMLRPILRPGGEFARGH